VQHHGGAGFHALVGAGTEVLDQILDEYAGQDPVSGQRRQR
jgi:hypothetical protein